MKLPRTQPEKFRILYSARRHWVMSKTWCSGGSEKAGPDSSTKPLYIGYRVRVKKKEDVVGA